MRRMMKTTKPPLKCPKLHLRASGAKKSVNDLKIGDIIESRHTFHFPPTATVRQACEMMALLSMGAIPVISDEGLVGIFTERDVVSKVMASDKQPDEILLSEVMTNRVVSIGPSTKVSRARRMMLEKGFRHLPVVARGEVLGIVSIRDLMD